MFFFFLGSQRNLTITHPAGQESWVSGQEYVIKWDTQGVITDVNVYLGRKSMSGIRDCLIFSRNAGGECRIVLPFGIQPAYDYYFDVHASDAPDICASSGVFSINVEEPHCFNAIENVQAASKVWLSGGLQEVTWDTKGCIPTVDITISRMKGIAYPLNVIGSVENTGRHVVQVPAGLTPGMDYLVTVGSEGIFNVQCESQPISMNPCAAVQELHLLEPGEGHSWQSGQLQTVRWEWTGDIDQVTIALMSPLRTLPLNGVLEEHTGLSWRFFETLVFRAPNTGSHQLRVPSGLPPSGDYFIELWTPGLLCRTKGAAFSINAGGEAQKIAFEVLPRGWQSGKQSTLRFSVTGDIERVNIFLLRDSATLKKKLAYEVPASSGLWGLSIDVPDGLQPAFDYYIRIESVHCDVIASVSPHFSINEPVLQIVSLKGQRIIGGTLQVSWTTLVDDTSVREVELQLYSGEERLYSFPGTFHASMQRATVILPRTLPAASSYRLKLKDLNDVRIFTFSNPFEIQKSGPNNHNSNPNQPGNLYDSTFDVSLFDELNGEVEAVATEELCRRCMAVKADKMMSCNHRALCERCFPYVLQCPVCGVANSDYVGPSHMPLAEEIPDFEQDISSGDDSS